MKTPTHFKLSFVFVSTFLLLRFSFAYDFNPFSVSPLPEPWHEDPDDDISIYDCNPPPPPPVPCNSQDEATLLRIKQALNNSTILSSWVPGTDCCNGWEFVGCDSTTGHVTTFSFYGNGWDHDDLPRILPSAVGDLTYLTNLNFYNKATGPIPSALGKLNNLTYLYLSNNQFSGPIPTFFSRMENLLWLDLSGNKLTGRLPSSLADTPSLHVVKLNNNRLTGHIPKSFGQFKNIHYNVFTMDLSYNQLIGRIPRSFGSVDFRSLYLSGNRLTGDASFLFGKEKNVWVLDLSDNRLSFNMSNMEIPHQLAWLGLSQNRIYGGLSPSLVDIGFSYLNVSYNRLRGPIPQGGSLQNFDHTAYFHNNGLCGSPLPACTRL